MGFKVRSLMRKLIILMMLMQFGFFKLLGEYLPIFSTSYAQYPLVVFYTIMVFFIWFMVVSQPPSSNRYLSIMMILVVMAVVLGIFVGIQKNSIYFMQGLSQGINYLYVLLAIPIYNLLVNERWNLRSLLKQLVFYGILSYILRSYISVYHGLTGTVVFANIAQESAVEGWIRNNTLRINPPFIGIIFVPVVYYLARTTKRYSYKFLYYMLIFGAIWYTSNIHQARSLLVYQLFTLVIMILSDRLNSKKALLRTMVTLMLLIYIVNTSQFNDFFSSFSTTNEELGGSTVARVNAVTAFGEQYLENLVTGIGFMSSSSQQLKTGGHISDIGMLGSVFTLGVPILMVYIMIFVRAFYVYKKAQISNLPDESLLVFGMTVLVLTTGINIDIFYAIFAFAMPFYVATIEYILYKVRMTQ